ncbi:sigma-54-dependent transcriptional regulator [Acanthopleuribacter pedis]|uniref:Sigma-54-dependent Fis family transcriptional regulator n=1 Tax=Acanthopleuribacter pedis TaxID=442870 RepID=A0A8J7QI53_9BACT|nr:sigma-54 dependent transcriptional regulator [Acanthopleuribacter pedis]MBO1321086.1 sigma-54-dependent Fis family transcriptional regulator [Acanthopleuribacter pedis]
MSVFNKKALKASKTADAKPKNHTILVVDDEPSNVMILEQLLQKEHQVLTAHDGRAALDLLKELPEPQRVHLIITDQRMPRMSGLDFLREAKHIVPQAKRIILTGYTDFEVVVQAINQEQVFRFMMKPFDRNELREAVSSALEAYRAGMQPDRGIGYIVGQHPKLLHAMEMVNKVADADSPVLVLGETGTGKELVGRALYEHSSRCSKPYVVLHCSALPETLFESELFGHKRGAFTGATSDRLGRIAQADGGTLFIDEVAEIPMVVQAKLLRFLQFGEFQRVGSDRVESVDVRVISATHQNIPQMIEAGTFRRDLYYRLNVVEINLPPLRERKSDIPILAEYFLKKHWKRRGEGRLASDTLKILESYDFPGNVRELSHIIERCCLLSESAVIGPNLLPPAVLVAYGKSLSGVETTTIEEAAEKQAIHFETLNNEVLKRVREEARQRAADEVEKQFLAILMEENAQNVSAAAREADMQRSYLHRLLSKHGFKTS